jgi:mRNA-degrading endonuclease RelE of RelBE toxin-antitoxin system
MHIFLTSTFKRAAKKLHRNQILILDKAIQTIQNNPTVGEIKKGDLAGIRVYKFRILQQLILLAYDYDELNEKLILLSFSTHENFYTDLKHQLKN